MYNSFEEILVGDREMAMLRSRRMWICRIAGFALSRN